MAVSNLKCNTAFLNFIIEHFLWRFEAETCARPRVEAEFDFFEIAACVNAQINALWQILSQEAICVLV